MSHHAPSISSLQSTERIGRDVTGGESQWQSRNSPRTTSIHILDDDSLLHVFDLYRPFLLGEDEDAEARVKGGNRGWVRGHWWYKLAHVCQRWRGVILGSAAYLDLSLVCTYGTPVADMLAHSPPLPLDIDFFRRDMTAEDEETIGLALKQRDRVRRVRLFIPVTSLQKLIVVINEGYPILEFLFIEPPVKDRSSTSLILPETVQAPHLRHLSLKYFALPIGSRLLTTAVGLVTLSLVVNPPSTYLHQNTLLQWISLMPQLETLLIGFSSPVPNRDVRQLTHTPIVTPVTLPNLRQFTFRGISAYLEALVPRITAPRLEKLEIVFFNQLTFSVPRLLQFLNTTDNFRFDTAGFVFSDKRVVVIIYPYGNPKKYAIGIAVDCLHLDWQASFAAQISYYFSQMSSAVEHLGFDHEVHSLSSDVHNKVDRTELRKLLSPFSNVKTLRIDNGLVKDLSHCLELEDGALPLELLPELEELTYSASGDTGDAFSSFINARQNAGHPVTLVRE